MNFIKLPSGYEPIKTINLVKDKNARIAVNILYVSLMIIMIAFGFLFSNMATLEQFIKVCEKIELWRFIFKAILSCILGGIYVVIHEVIHLFFMKLFCPEAKISFSYKVLYACAGSNAYFNKISYNLIAISPIAIMGALLTMVCLLVPASWFWTVYVVQILNVAGAAGDLYIFFIISRMNRDIMVYDSGVEMIVYSKK